MSKKEDMLYPDYITQNISLRRLMNYVLVTFSRVLMTPLEEQPFNVRLCNRRIQTISKGEPN